jgi:IS30 family transposase
MCYLCLSQCHIFSGYKYFLCLVDLFDNFVYTEALKSKDALTVLNALKSIIKKNDMEKISTIGSDEGSEFIGNKKQLKNLGINLYVLKGEHKAFQVHS